MTHAELHANVRELLDRKRMLRAFAVSVTSKEFHPGRVIVEWHITIYPTGNGLPAITARSIYPDTALRQVEDLLSELHMHGAEALDTIGEAP